MTSTNPQKKPKQTNNKKNNLLKASQLTPNKSQGLFPRIYGIFPPHLNVFSLIFPLAKMFMALVTE
jgi:hypothetical protein